MFWSLNDTVVFDSSSVQLSVQVDWDLFLAFICCYSKVQDDTKCIFLIALTDIKMDWNSICITMNISNHRWNIMVNGQLGQSSLLKHDNTFLNQLTEPFSIGKYFSFYGQITDFNIWSRPLSDIELNAYSSNCEEDFTKRYKPEVLTWANANITELGKNSRHFKISRTLLNCYNTSKMKQLPKNQQLIFENSAALKYDESLQFCHLLKGHLLYPNNSKLDNLKFNKKSYWVPAVKSKFENTLEPVL
jgi:hypothetical protein